MVVIEQHTYIPQKPLTRRFGLSMLKIISYIVFVLLAVYFTPKVLSRTLHTPYPLAVITSGSMWPVLKTNDLILMKGLVGTEAKIGQIIVYQNNQGFTIHRLVRIQPDGQLVTRGDANNVDDPAFPPTDVIGRAVCIGHSPVRLPYLGIIAKGLGPTVTKLEKKIN